MSKETLPLALNTANAELKAVEDALASVGSKASIQGTSLDFFSSVSDFRKGFQDVSNLLRYREEAQSQAIDLPKNAAGLNESEFRFERFSKLQTYCLTCWAIYDSMANAIGPQICNTDRVRNPNQTYSLPTDFLSKLLGCRLQDHLSENYGWPIAISYALRNWLAHNGEVYENTQLFEYSVSGGAMYELSQAAWNKTEEMCRVKYKNFNRQTRLKVFPDVKADVLSALITIHEEVDEAMVFLVAWSAASTKKQAQLLLSRDA